MESRPDPTPPAAADCPRRPLILCLLLAGLTVAVFLPVKGFDFVAFDDPEYVIWNEHVQNGLTLDGIRWAFGNFHVGNWHPLTWISHMLDVSLFGRTASGPHLTNLFLHVASTLILFVALWRMSSAYWPSAVVAALFAIHPMHVESVAWVSERKDVLSTFFGMLTLLAYGEWSRAAPGGKPRACLGLAVLCFALSLMSKPMLVTLPFVLLLLDYWPLQRMRAGASETLVRLALEKWPFFLLALVSCLITVMAQKSGGAVVSLNRLPFMIRLENAFISYAAYLGKLFWPFDLAIPYRHAFESRPGLAIAAATLVAGLSLASWLWVRRHPYLFTGWFWFLGTLVPVIGLVQVGRQAMADRYTYVPYIGLFVALAWGASAVVRRWHLPVKAAGAVAALVIAACAVRAADQVQYWRNTETLFRHSLALDPDNLDAYCSLGFFLQQEGRLQAAIEAYDAVLQRNPGHRVALEEKGTAFMKLGQVTNAIACYEAAVQAQPDAPGAQANLGLALERAGRLEEAVRHYQEAVRLQPQNPAVHYRLGNLLARAGRMDIAIQHYSLAVAQAPENLEAQNNLAVALYQSGDLPGAAGSFQQLLRRDPQNAGAHYNLANVLAQQNRWTEAMQHYQEAVRLAPDSADARFGLARVLARAGRQAEAISELNEALRLQPNHPGARQLMRSLNHAPPP